MRKSKREIERALDDIDPDPDRLGDPCEECGGFPEGADAQQGLTGEFVTIECTCVVELPDGCELLAVGDLAQEGELA